MGRWNAVQRARLGALFTEPRTSGSDSATLTSFWRTSSQAPSSYPKSSRTRDDCTRSCRHRKPQAAPTRRLRSRRTGKRRKNKSDEFPKAKLAWDSSRRRSRCCTVHGSHRRTAGRSRVREVRDWRHRSRCTLSIPPDDDAGSSPLRIRCIPPRAKRPCLTACSFAAGPACKGGRHGKHRHPEHRCRS